MDNMSLLDAVTVSIPEIIVMVLIGAILIKGNIFKSKEFNLKYVIKILLISIFFSLLLIKIRGELNSIIAISFFSLLVSVFIFRIILKFNLRQALLSSGLMILILIFTELVTFLIVDLLRKKYDGYYFDYRFIFSFPSRVLQIIILFICLKFNFKSNKLLNTDWKVLSKSKKITMIFVIILVFVTNLVNVNYLELYFKIKLFNADILSNPYMRSIFTNIQILFPQVVLFIIVTLALLNRTILYENYKEILNSPKKSFETLLYNSTEDEIHYYLKLMKSYLDVIQIEKVEQLLKKMKDSSKNFHYHIDKRLILTSYNFKKIYLILEIFLNSFLNQINFENIIVTLGLTNLNDIGFNIKIVLNDIEKRKLLKIIEKNLNMENIKFSLIDDRARYQIIKDKHFILDIQIPYEEVKSDGRVY